MPLSALQNRIGSWFERLAARLRALRAPIFAPTWAIFMLSVSATVLSAWVTHMSVQAASAERFRLETMRVSEEVGDKMATYEHLLRAGQGLFNALGFVSEAEWRRFVATLDLDRNFPGIQGLGVAKIVAKADLARHLVEVRQTHPNYDVRPLDDRDVLMPIVYIEPLDSRNAPVRGFDMSTEATRRGAMERARDSGNPHATSRVFLVQEGEGDIQSGLLMYIPVYGIGADISSVEKRRAALTGFVYAAFRLQDYFDFAIRTSASNLLTKFTVRAYDAPPSMGGQLLFTSQPDRVVADRATQNGVLTRTATREVAGQQWHLVFEELPAFRDESDHWQPWLVLCIGALITALISAIAGTLAVARTRALSAQHVLETEVDIRKRAQSALEEANRDVLISNQELIHRVKNLMAVVSSIASQTARYTPDPAEFNSVFRDRLAALGRVHDFLKPNPVFMPDIQLLFPEVLSPYRGGRKALELDGPSIEVTQSSAVMLSLVLNELATNAVRHGAWSVPSGRVQLSWKVEAAAGEEIVEMTWREIDGPPVVAPTRKGFGSNVLKFAVEQGLRGTFKIDYCREGLSCVWRVPRTRRATGPKLSAY